MALSLGRKPKENEEKGSLAAKRRQQIDNAQIAVAASRLNSREHSATHGLRRGLRAVAASRLTRLVGNNKATCCRRVRDYQIVAIAFSLGRKLREKKKRVLSREAATAN